MSEDKRPDSLPQSRSGLTVAPSPLNGVKLELAIILCIGVVLLLIQGHIPVVWGQYALLGGYGFAAMIWLIVRTRRVAARLNDGIHEGK